MLFRDQNLNTLSAEKIPALGCVMVPEGRQVFATMSVEENLILGAHVLQKEGKQVVEELLEHQYTLFPVLRDRKNSWPEPCPVVNSRCWPWGGR